MPIRSDDRPAATIIDTTAVVVSNALAAQQVFHDLLAASRGDLPVGQRHPQLIRALQRPSNAEELVRHHVEVALGPGHRGYGVGVTDRSLGH